MPAIAAHYYFGAQVYSMLGERERAALDANRDAFDLGLQGPDILFNYQPLKQNDIGRRGSAIHAMPYCDYVKNVGELVKNGGDALRAYCAGLTCHFVLDSALHPAVNAGAGDMSAHYLLEAELDRQFLLAAGIERPERFGRWRLVPCKKELAASIAPLYGVSADDAYLSIKRTRFFSRLLYSPGGVKRAFVRMAENIIGKKNAFSVMCVCARPALGAQPRAMMALVPQARADAAACVMALWGYLDTKAALPMRFNSNFV